MSVNQTVSHVLVVLRLEPPLTPYRRRITIRWQSGGGPLQLPRSSRIEVVIAYPTAAGCRLVWHARPAVTQQRACAVPGRGRTRDVTHSYPPSFAAAGGLAPGHRSSRPRCPIGCRVLSPPRWWPHIARTSAPGLSTRKKPLIAVTSKPAWRADRGRSSTTPAGTPFRCSTS